MMAGAERVEGTLFGNGERTGNVCVVTLALNLFTQGVDPRTGLSDIRRRCAPSSTATRLPVHPRHPYGGDLVFTAFSGRIRTRSRRVWMRSRRRRRAVGSALPCRRSERLGRNYEAIIRINSQSGKGGIAYVMATDYGLELPRNVQIEFSKVVQAHTDETGAELTAPNCGMPSSASISRRPGRSA